MTIRYPILAIIQTHFARGVLMHGYRSAESLSVVGNPPSRYPLKIAGSRTLPPPAHVTPEGIHVRAQNAFP